jgi:glycosyltransferase involved in cell wall biosynthesis
MGVDEVRAIMGRASIVAVPSVTADDGDSEGLPTVLLEAQAISTAVVATRHSGIPEGVIDGETALLVPERDHEALANAIRTLIEDPSRCRAMGEAGREFVLSRFSLASRVERLESVYEQVVSEHARRKVGRGSK